METLLVEITDKIFEQIFWDNPQNFYRLRGVSKAWKDIIDRYTSRSSRLWCNKCTDTIPEIYLDDMIQTRFPKLSSWQDYCSKNNICPRPDIARDIYESRNEFPHLTHNNVRLTKIHCPPPESGGILLAMYACVKDEYLAINWMWMENSNGRKIYVVRIYSINDLNHHIREYPSFQCRGMDFYCTDKQIFLVLTESDYDRLRSTYLADFLVDDRLIPSNLPKIDDEGDKMHYLITDNQCFTYKPRSNRIQHYRLTPDGFKPGILLQVPHAEELTIRRNIEIYNSTLFVSHTSSELFAYNDYSTVEMITMRTIIYQYKITGQSDNELFFSAAEIYDQIDQNMHSAILYSNCGPPFEELAIYFGANNIVRAKAEWSNCLKKLNYVIKNRMKIDDNINRITAYPHHLLIECNNRIVVFRGNLLRLLDYFSRQDEPYCLRPFHVVNLKFLRSYYSVLGIIRNENVSKFVVRCNHQVYIVDLDL